MERDTVSEESELVTCSEAPCSTASSRLSSVRRNAEVARLKAAQARRAAAAKVEIAKREADAEAQAAEDEAEVCQLEVQLLEEDLRSQDLSDPDIEAGIRHETIPASPAARAAPAVTRTPVLSPAVAPVSRHLRSWINHRPRELCDTDINVGMQHTATPVPPAVRPVPAVAHATARSPADASARVRSWIDQLPTSSIPADGFDGRGTSDRCQHQVGSSLPKLTLDKFGGSPLEWPRWISLFKSLIHDSPQLSNAEKLTHLQTYLIGDAREAVQGYLCDGALYPDALRELERQFGDHATVARVNMDRVLSLPAVRENDFHALAKLSSALHTAVSVLKCLHYEADLAATSNVRNVVAKLPRIVAWKWGEMKVDSYAPLTLADLDELLRRYVAAGRQVCESPPEAEPGLSGERTAHKSRRAVNATTLPERGGTAVEDSCYCCSGSHEVGQCAKFKAMNAEERAEIAKAHQLCFKCLRSSAHIAARCPVKENCTSDGCGKRHHRLLHGAGKVFPPRKSPERPTRHTDDSVPNQAANVGHTSARHDQGTVLLQVLPVIIHGPRGSKAVNALMDLGSEVSLIEAELAGEVGLEMGQAEPLQLSTVNNKRTHASHKVSFDLEANAPIDREIFSVSDVRTVNGLGIHTQVIDWPSRKNSWPHLADLPLAATESPEVKVLLGADCFRLIVPREVRDGPPGSPSAVRCQLGWTVSNRLPSSHRLNVTNARVNHISASDSGLERQMSQFWTTESFGTKYEEKPSRSRNDLRALDMLESSTVLRDGRYHTDLLWNRPDVTLPDNREAALTRLKHTERKLDKNPKMARMYSETIEGYINDGLAMKVTDRDDEESRMRWYLPHHGVVSPKKPDKVRVVFDAAARYGGTSLNDNLLTGPDLVNNLIGVLMRFRQGPVPLSADIQAMYHAVGVTKSHQPALRFLWRGSDRNKEPESYQMKVHVFGAASSSCAVNYALRKCADEGVKDYPAASAAVYKNFYVDDLLVSMETREEANQLKESLTEMLKRGGFKLTKWVVPHQQVACATASRDLDLDDLPVERALGVHWNIVDDSFIFKVTKMDNPCTKRGILSQVSSVFDPLGMLTPFIMRAKCLLQRVWSGGYGWDDDIDDTRLITEWLSWLDEIADLQRFSMHRFYRPGPSQPVTCQLHVFCDASCTGFGATAYFRFRLEDGTIWCSFVAAKGRVAPLKQLTIPRLELQAAVMAVRLAVRIREEHSIDIDSTHFWSDSRTVLQWLKSESGRFHTFVANRVAEIQDSSDANEWRHVPGTLNIADICSRGCKASELTPDSEWARGPAFIWQPKEAWPTERNEKTENAAGDTEMKQTAHAALTEDNGGGDLTDPARYSSLLRLLRVTAWARRFCLNCRAGTERRSKGPLSVAEISDAELFWLRKVQENGFAEELSALKQGRNIPHRSRLLPLCPYLDERGLIRVGGRLRHADMPDASRHQIVLPPEHDITRMLAFQYHLRLAHPGPEHTLCALRERFWPLRGRATVKKWTAPCLVCRRRRANPAPPVMADLPVSRVTSHEPPFSRIAVDYFGPLHVKRLRKTEKRYGCLFTCLATRAVHVEIAHSLDADSFIMALRRMSARRGAPKEVYSDNGTNLRGGERELRECLQVMNSDKVADSLSQKGIQWHFSPPAAPHFGGVWERMVKSVKRALSVTVQQTVSDETLLTVMCEVEGIVNSRPLTHVSAQSDDLQALTPSHLLMGRGNPCLAPGVFTDNDLCTRRRWRHAQRMADHFWTRWRREYLPTLNMRRKWTRESRNLEAGDLVLIIEDNEARGHWPLGRVVRCVPGGDGRVRRVEVKTSTGTYTRPAARLCLLEENDE